MFFYNIKVMERMKRGYTNWDTAAQTYETVLDSGMNIAFP